MAGLRVVRPNGPFGMKRVGANEASDKSMVVSR